MRRIDVKAYKPNGEFVGEYHGLAEAERATGASFQHIGKILKGKERRKTAGGLVWVKADTTEEELKEILNTIPNNTRIVNTYESEELKKYGIKYVQKNKEGKIVGLWKSAYLIAKHYGISQGAISANLHGRTTFVDSIDPSSKFYKVI